MIDREYEKRVEHWSKEFGIPYTPHTPTLVADVITYGAIGDGVTDDTNAIQFAINTLENEGGGTLLFPPGTYKYTNIEAKVAISLLGSGPDQTVLTGPGVISLAPNSSLQNFTLKHSLIQASHNNTIRHNWVQNNGSFGINLRP